MLIKTENQESAQPSSSIVIKEEKIQETSDNEAEDKKKLSSGQVESDNESVDSKHFDSLNNSKLEPRATPRRRARSGGFDDQPVFLRKAFLMITNSPPDIACWSDSGDYIIVKDVKQFSEKVIPTVYKHNNFSSFVRQLNFYGFRKVKIESLQRPDWWEFRHPNFLRDKPHLLNLIKRSDHYAVTNSEVNELKSQVQNLNEKIASLNDQVSGLTDMVSTLKIEQKAVVSTSKSLSSSPSSENLYSVQLSGGGNKKRKINQEDTSVAGTYEGVAPIAEDGGIPLIRISSLESQAMNSDFETGGLELLSGPELFSRNDFFGETNFLNTPRTPSTTANPTQPSHMLDIDSSREIQSNNCSNNNQLNDECLFDEVLSVLDENKEIVETRNANQTNESNHEQVTSMGNIQSVFESLDADLKKRFIDKLAESFSKQLFSSMQPQISKCTPQLEREITKLSQSISSSSASSTSPSSISASLIPSPISVNRLSQKEKKAAKVGRPSRASKLAEAKANNGKGPTTTCSLTSASNISLEHENTSLPVLSPYNTRHSHPSQSKEVKKIEEKDDSAPSEQAPQEPASISEVSLPMVLATINTLFNSLSNTLANPSQSHPIDQTL